MARIGSQNRLLIPQDLTTWAFIDQGDVGIYWDEKQKTIYISSLDNKNAIYCIAIRKLDNKNRICIPENILNLIGADYTSELIVALRSGRIYILNPDRD